jgi:hypothetical protein
VHIHVNIKTRPEDTRYMRTRYTRDDHLVRGDDDVGVCQQFVEDVVIDDLVAAILWCMHACVRVSMCAYKYVYVCIGVSVFVVKCTERTVLNYLVTAIACGKTECASK